jgi:4-carboxymuconolactone decarboxylase
VNDPSSSRESTAERGLRIRKEVLGAAHVERSLAAADEFSRPLQELVTEYCWGAVWGRDGLPRHTRSLLNIAMLAALGRDDELRLHVRASLTNGCTPEEISEVIMQVAIYCGVPAALAASRAARAVLVDAGAIPSSPTPPSSQQEQS